MKFHIQSPYQPTGDQPKAIEQLVAGIEKEKQYQTLLGVTGSGKSIGYDDQVFIIEEKNGHKISTVIPIGPFLDKAIQEGDIPQSPHKEGKARYYTQSYNPYSGLVDIFPISAFTRHQAPSKMFHLITDCGRSITLTGDHNLWVLRDGEVTLIKTDEAKVSDAVPIPLEIPFENNVKEYTVDTLEVLKGLPLFVDGSSSIQAFILKNGPKSFAKIFSEQSKKNPYSKLFAIRQNIRGKGIQVDTFLQLLKETKKFDNLWQPEKATIGARSKNHRLPAQIQLDNNWLRFIGYFLAEGCCQKRYIILANYHKDIRKFIEDFLLKTKIPFLIRPSSDYQISSLTLTSLMNIFCGNLAGNKHLPLFWSELNISDLATLLSAYYDGDGTVSKNGEVIATTASQALASDLAYSLLKFGIWARIRKKWKKATNTDHKGNWYYDISVSGQENLQKFSTRINFSVQHKKKRLEEFIGRTNNTNKDLVFGVGDKLRALRSQLGLFQREISSPIFLSRSAMSLIEQNHRSPSRKIFSLILSSLEKSAKQRNYSDKNWWQDISSLKKLENTHWSLISSVEKADYPHPYVYDFTVPIAETFLAGNGGLFVHNTFTMANVIEKTNLPTLIIAHNKTLAGQLYQEFRDFFPNNAVSYFVSYYDYYQPEAYIPTTDTYIEKEATINDEIDKLRLATTTNLLTRPDCIVVASVSCIYNLGSPVEYGKYILEIIEGEIIARETLLLQLNNLQYQRSDADFIRGSYRLRGDTIQLWPASEDKALQIETLDNRILRIFRIEPLTGTEIVEERKANEKGNFSPKRFVIYPAKHYMTNPQTQAQSLAEIERDLTLRLAELRGIGKIVEAYRLEQKVRYDIDMIRELGFVNGIENYSRYFDGRKPGDAPYSLIEYFHENARLFHNNSFLTIVDESHMSIPQVRGMYNGDQARKQTLIDYGFRLPSALDNRPLKFPEFMGRMKKMIFVSATPNAWEVSMSENEVVEQLIRPTGLIDPHIELRPIKGQIEDLIIEIIRRKQIGQRCLVTTLTKKMAEALTEYLNDPDKVEKLIAHHSEHDRELADADLTETVQYQGDELPVDEMEIGKVDSKFYTRARIVGDFSSLRENFPKVAYLHSDIQTLERSDILDDLRRGEYDVVVGINLLREGLDLPEVTLVAILDADKEGFLRSRTSLIQTIGRAARHESGEVIMYADRMTKSMQGAIGETQRRRTVQWKYNQDHGITATTIYKPIRDRMIAKVEEDTPQYETKRTSNSPAARTVKLNKHEEINLAQIDPAALTPDDKKKLSAKLRRRMKQAANDMDFELAAEIRDIAKSLEETSED